jgi:Ras-related C3 botulinum toxin substrate 1
VKSKWVPEISHHAPNVPFVLVGMQNDRDNRCVTNAAGAELASVIGAREYVECSSLEKANVDAVLWSAVNATSKLVATKEKEKRGRGMCVIL